MEITAYTGFLLVWAVNLFSVCLPNALNKEFKNKKKKHTAQDEAVGTQAKISVVIPTYNQETQLMHLLECVLQQTYDSFEVVVVDKNSTDNTRILLENMEKRYENLQYTFVPKDTRHVSIHTLALTLGIKAARYPWIVLLTPEFLPASTFWLQHLAEEMTSNKNFVLGGISTKQQYGSLRSFYLQTEQNRFLSWAICHQAFRGNEVNLAFRKEIFLSCKNFGEYGGLLSGMEGILVNRFSRAESTAVCITPESLLIESHIPEGYNWKEKMLSQKEAEHFYIHKRLYHLYGSVHMCCIWLLFLFTIFSFATSIFMQRWEFAVSIIVLLCLWIGLRIRQQKVSAHLFRIKSPGIYLPFYELRLSCVYLYNRIRYAFLDKKVFYRKLF